MTRLCDEEVGEDIVANAAAQNEEVEDLVGAEVLVDRVKDGELQRIDHAARRVDDAADEKPQECGEGQRLP